MPSLASLAADRGRQIERIMSKITVQQLHYSKVKPSQKNFYRQCDIEELADALIQAGRIMEPLIVVKTDIGEYEVLSGHRRRNAAIMNVEQRGKKEFEFLPCIVLSKEEIEKITDGMDMEYLEDYLEYLLIITNSSSRDRNDYERMMEAMKLKELIPKLRGDEELKGRALRAEIAKEMKRSTGSVGMYESIYKNLIGEWMEKFAVDEIGVTIAAGLASLPEAKQGELVGRQVTLNDIREIKDQIRQQETVSNFDTVEEPQDLVNTQMEEHSETVEEPKWMPEIEENWKKAIEKVFDGSEENQFYPEVFARLLEIFSKVSSSSQGMIKAENEISGLLPYENNEIKLYKNGRYVVLFKAENKAVKIPIYYFWEQFWNSFNYMWQDGESDTEDEYGEVEEVAEIAEDEEKLREVDAAAETVENYETGFNVCVQGMNGYQMCESFRVSNEYEVADKIRSGILGQILGNDVNKLQIRVTVERL